MSIWSQSLGTGSDLVVLHGWGLNSHVWQPVQQQLAQQHRLHLIDLPGYGESAWPQGLPVSLDNCVDILLAHLPDRFHVLGWSLGGLMATRMALVAPQRVQSLVTVASSPKFQASAEWPGMDSQILANFAEQLNGQYRKTIERFLAIQAMGSPTARAQVKQMKSWVLSKPEPNIEALKGGLALLAQVDLREQLAQIQQPFLRMYGKLDSLVPVAVADAVADYAPMSQQWIAQGCAHAPFVSATEAFLQRLQQFYHT
ncbi:pimeloyl-ACP methyl ester esterase BioH [Idiomarina xiamenensis]|uniref:Pimeloyl-[acyl-carrier protein] methyl ester esterase n=1 Tax=Idiomarina xiamenensis 10-D-4 TaxID=740709 RepID=K2KV32_9GAMM|nr:pimeloyl-ACP methyl ester esterase BioH [Idiomarina xiamenensis]EKE81485.1 alpha/beta hydrolase [Idiomarina xiamenensis 10-D-4]